MSPHQVLEPHICLSQSKPTWMGKEQLYLDFRFKADLPEKSTFGFGLWGSVRWVQRIVAKITVKVTFVCRSTAPTDATPMTLQRHLAQRGRFGASSFNRIDQCIRHAEVNESQSKGFNIYIGRKYKISTRPRYLFLPTSYMLFH